MTRIASRNFHEVNFSHKNELRQTMENREVLSKISLMKFDMQLLQH